MAAWKLGCNIWTAGDCCICCASEYVNPRQDMQGGVAVKKRKNTQDGEGSSTLMQPTSLHSRDRRWCAYRHRAHRGSLPPRQPGQHSDVGYITMKPQYRQGESYNETSQVLDSNYFNCHLCFLLVDRRLNKCMLPSTLCRLAHRQLDKQKYNIYKNGHGWFFFVTTVNR